MTRKLDRLKPKKVKGRITVLKALPYRDCMIYVRMIDKEIFEYLALFKNEIYSAYMIIKPKKGQTKLTPNEVAQCTELLWAGGTATIDMKLGIKLDKETLEKVRTFESTKHKA